MSARVLHLTGENDAGFHGPSKRLQGFSRRAPVLHPRSTGCSPSQTERPAAANPTFAPEASTTPQPLLRLDLFSDLQKPVSAVVGTFIAHLEVESP